MQLKNYISEKTEDYLEAIFLLVSHHNVARVRDIAELMRVTMSTVTNTLKKLSEKGLINYDKYQVITLTEKGASIAEVILRKHQILSDFLHNILNIDKNKADENACQIEHHLDEEVIEKLLHFITFIQTSPNKETNWISKFNKFCQEVNISEKGKRYGFDMSPPFKKHKNTVHKSQGKIKLSLADLKIGDEVLIKKISSESNVFNHLAAMGLVQGTKVKVLKTDPAEDFIEIRVRGYTIDLRKDEAFLIEVEKLCPSVV